MKKSYLIFSFFCLFFVVACNHIDDDEMIFGDTDADTADTDADTADTNADTADTNTDTGDTNADTGDTNTDTGDTNADTGDTNADTGDTNADTGDTNADTGDSGADTGDTNADTGDTNADTGDSGADTGDSGADTGDSGADTGDSGADTGDSGADTGDSGADTGDSGADTGDSGADTGDSGADTGDSGELPECSKGSATPCKAGNLIWSSRSNTTKNWEGAKAACANWSEGEFTNGWELPKISALRTLIINCQKTEPDGSCGVTDQCVITGENIDGTLCYTNSSCYKVFGDLCSTSQDHSVFGDKDQLWSASYPTDNPGFVWYVDFNDGSIGYNKLESETLYFRCVHNL